MVTSKNTPLSFANCLIFLALFLAVIFGFGVSSLAQAGPGKDTPPEQPKATPGIRVPQNTSSQTSSANVQTSNSTSSFNQQSVNPITAIDGSPTVRTGGPELLFIPTIIICGGGAFYYYKRLKFQKSSLKTHEKKIKPNK